MGTETSGQTKLLSFKITFDWDNTAPESKEYANVIGVLKKGSEVEKEV